MHEMGHVLGIGTLWNIADRNLLQGPTSSPYFAGRKANVFWNAEGEQENCPSKTCTVQEQHLVTGKNQH